MPGNVTADLIRALIDNMQAPNLDAEGWEALAIILEFPDGEFNEAHGYLYWPDGVVSAVASDPWAVAPAVKAYTDSYYKPGEALPRKALVQLDRTTGEYRVTFEETDEGRWKTTPRNFRQLREELRPQFT
ncbi:MULTISPECIES: hypothetical protein [unclassified Microbacterium]|uniref:hypothetical protein n=1 Tax=unclassified Microbacterium TaxID=2609290 RepID=UPI00214ABB78|nr:MULTISPECIES: hypothetical protein [unclassified Microbacterium]MCR2810794.1 hypothetical protein [Microbacterium sp. zg.B185]WIM18325.1 hypothetical protein QNO12_12030 [Microbacterium sp. zg-B185]